MKKRTKILFGALVFSACALFSVNFMFAGTCDDGCVKESYNSCSLAVQEGEKQYDGKIKWGKIEKVNCVGYKSR